MRIFLRIFICLLLIVCLCSTASGDVALVRDEAVDRYVSYSFILKNTKNAIVPQVKFWAYAPIKDTESQQCLKITSNQSHEIVTDLLGNRILKFEFDNLGPFATKIITVEARLKMFSTPRRISSTVAETFLKPEKYIETDALEVIKLAQQLKGTDSKDTVRGIYNWVSNTLTYIGYIKNDRGALWALQNRSGDCTEFAYLFTTLCRASGIPSRVMGGYYVLKNCVLNPSDYHNWAEFYLDGQWRVADPQKKLYMKNENNYIATRILSQTVSNEMKGFHRFRFKGKGVKVIMQN
jgi:transglutaminase-like putative cysteine protease